MLNMVWDFIFFIITFGLLITVHEFGHFYMARFYGVKVNLFSIGLGKQIVKFNIRDTNFAISIIPIGGYIRMLDGRFDDIPVALLNQTFNNKPIWKRAFIILAGPAANAILAIFIYLLVFLKGSMVSCPVIGHIKKGSIVEKAQIESRMAIKKIDHIDTPNWNTVRMILMSKIDMHENILLTLVNIDNKITYRRKINLSELKYTTNNIKDPLQIIGIIPLDLTKKLVVTKINKEIVKNGLQLGDEITKLEGNELNLQYNEFNSKYFINNIKPYLNKNITLDINRHDKIIKLVINSNEIMRHYVKKNLSLAPLYNVIYYKFPQNNDILLSFIKAVKRTYQLMKLTFYSLLNLIKGNTHLNGLSGPISIAKGASSSAKHGIINYLLFLSLISINLSVFNLFPLPVLDGGHLLLLIVEKIRGKPLSEQVQNIFYIIGFSVLIILIIVALSNDFSNFIIGKI
ncbi:RIP metalloprotease RseP [Candidatus Pantoea edessiphila]|uniref:Zinc metalloprotease n=1 Tax=Candidatus Pantoea edessiphila TaxID=2044610 RepID=A0A2P5T263_9GAMM|nr:RIP metalloprotease RseP [Candidatus Pantoea edessiphila]PPI88679.1 RIP metalloprotease RseP [Candidatus Pantoea edessiphila]